MHEKELVKKLLRVVLDSATTDAERANALDKCRTQMAKHNITSYAIFADQDADVEDDLIDEIARLQASLNEKVALLRRQDAEIKRLTRQVSSKGTGRLTPDKFMRIAKMIAVADGYPERSWPEVMGALLNKTPLTVKQMTRDPLVHVEGIVTEEMNKRGLSID